MYHTKHLFAGRLVKSNHFHSWVEVALHAKHILKKSTVKFVEVYKEEKLKSIWFRDYALTRMPGDRYQLDYVDEKGFLIPFGFCKDEDKVIETIKQFFVDFPLDENERAHLQYRECDRERNGINSTEKMVDAFSFNGEIVVCDSID